MRECSSRVSYRMFGHDQAPPALNVVAYIASIQTFFLVLKRATWTFDDVPSSSVVLFSIMHNRPSSILITVRTYPMRGIDSLTRFLQRIQTASIPGSYQLVSLLCFVPCPNTANLFFKLTCLLHQCELVRLRRKCTGLGIKNGTLKINDLGLDIRQVVKALHGLGNLCRCPDSTNGSCDAWDINHVFPPWAAGEIQAYIAILFRRGQMNSPGYPSVSLFGLRFTKPQVKSVCKCSLQACSLFL